MINLYHLKSRCHRNKTAENRSYTYNASQNSRMRARGRLMNDLVNLRRRPACVAVAANVAGGLRRPFCSGSPI